MELPYRKCVVAVITNADGLALVGERADRPGAWQFPQGGIDEGESAEQALLRELKEEIGCGDVRILKVAAKPVRYRFPKDLGTAIAKRYAGQEQVWFHVAFNDGAGPRLDQADGEFRATAWRPVGEVVRGIIEWKRETYEQGLALLDVAKGG